MHIHIRPTLSLGEQGTQYSVTKWGSQRHTHTHTYEKYKGMYFLITWPLTESGWLQNIKFLPSLFPPKQMAPTFSTHYYTTILGASVYMPWPKHMTRGVGSHHITCIDHCTAPTFQLFEDCISLFLRKIISSAFSIWKERLIITIPIGTSRFTDSTDDYKMKFKVFFVITEV